MSEQINVAVAKLLGWTDFEEKTYWLEDYHDISEVTGLEGRPKGSDTRRLIPDYCHDLNAALAAAGRKLPGTTITIRIGEDTPLVYYVRIHRYPSDLLELHSIEAIAAAICEAILQAHGITVSEQAGGE